MADSIVDSFRMRQDWGPDGYECEVVKDEPRINLDDDGPGSGHATVKPDGTAEVMDGESHGYALYSGTITGRFASGGEIKKVFADGKKVFDSERMSEGVSHNMEIEPGIMVAGTMRAPQDIFGYGDANWRDGDYSGIEARILAQQVDDLKAQLLRESTAHAYQLRGDEIDIESKLKVVSYEETEAGGAGQMIERRLVLNIENRVTDARTLHYNESTVSFRGRRYMVESASFEPWDTYTTLNLIGVA